MYLPTIKGFPIVILSWEKLLQHQYENLQFKSIKMKWKCHKAQTYPSLFALSSHFSLTDCNNLKSPLFPLISLHFLCRATMEEDIFCHKNTAWTTNLVKDDSKNSGHYLWWFDKKAWFQICLENSHNHNHKMKNF